MEKSVSDTTQHNTQQEVLGVSVFTSSLHVHVCDIHVKKAALRLYHCGELNRTNCSNIKKSF